jgi:hypothetical protein
MQVRQLDAVIRLLLSAFVLRHLSPLAWQKSQARDARCLLQAGWVETSAPRTAMVELDDMVVPCR